MKWTPQMTLLALNIEVLCILRYRISISNRDDSVEFQAIVVVFCDLGEICVHQVDAGEHVSREEIL